MHYLVNNNILIKSENAALSTIQTNRQVIQMISQLPYASLVLDYGCGKLRYSLPLSSIVKKIIAIDSIEQIERRQVINGVKTTVREYVQKNLTNLEVFDINSSEWLRYKFDFILCTNVLSAIPNHSERLKVLNNIKTSLSNNGNALITVQYRNSYFSNYCTKSNAMQYYDGWIIKNRDNHTFYGLIYPDVLKDLCKEAGLKIVSMKLLDGSAYVLIQ